MEEEKIKNALLAKFPAMADKVTVTRPRRIFAEIPQGQFNEVFEFARTTLGLTVLCAITGLDEETHYSILYHLSRPEGIVCTFRRQVPKDAATVGSITSIFPVADVYEREIVDLLGIQVEGLAPGSRYPLPDNWPSGQYPLRKDWKGGLSS